MRMLPLPKPSCLVSHTNTISTFGLCANSFPSSPLAHQPNLNHFSTRHFRGKPSKTDWTQLNTKHQKQLVSKIMEKRRTPPNASTSKSERAKPTQLHDKGVVFCLKLKSVKLNECRCQSRTAFLFPTSNFHVPQTQATAARLLQLPHKQSWEERNLGAERARRQLHGTQ